MRQLLNGVGAMVTAWRNRTPYKSAPHLKLAPGPSRADSNGQNSQLTDGV
jgi:hypothetical protein